ncbi:hypothetical protein OY671_012926, partial [Metschnikowia pulcherrima]
RGEPEGGGRLWPNASAGYGAAQARLLRVAADVVRPGGRSTYIVCSSLDAEGADGVAAFSAERQDWRSDLPTMPAGRARGAGWRLTPAHDGTDGFFFSTLRRL